MEWFEIRSQGHISTLRPKLRNQNNGNCNLFVIYLFAKPSLFVFRVVDGMAPALPLHRSNFCTNLFGSHTFQILWLLASTCVQQCRQTILARRAWVPLARVTRSVAEVHANGYRASVRRWECVSSWSHNKTESRCVVDGVLIVTMQGAGVGTQSRICGSEVAEWFQVVKKLVGRTVAQIVTECKSYPTQGHK